MGGHRNPKPFDLDAPEDDDWEDQIQHTIRFFKALTWWPLTSADDRISASVPRGEDGRREFDAGGGLRTYALPPQTTYWALADGEERCVIGYMRGMTDTVTLTLGEGRYAVRQFDPRSGDWLTVADANGSIRFKPPDDQDWLIVAEKSS